MAKLFSIVIPTYNSKDYVLETVQSALNQSYSNVEVVVDDNASNDGTAELISRHFAKDSRLKLYKNNEDLNIPLGWNRSMKRATGEWRLLLHSDNLLSPYYVESAVYFLEKYNADVAYTECNYFNGETPPDLFTQLSSTSLSAIPHTFLSPGTRAIDYVFRYQRMIPTSCLAINASCFKKREPYHHGYKWDPDIELMTWLARNCSIIHINTPLAAIRSHGGQAASWKDPTFTKQYEELLRTTNTEGLIEPHHFLLNWARSNEDIVEKLSVVRGAKIRIYFNYLRKWLHAENKLLIFFLRHYVRKLRLMSSLCRKRLRLSSR